MTSHRSSAYIKAIDDRGRAWKPDPITNQFRFIVRMAYACHERNVPYDLAWERHESVMRATITATGTIPMPKPLPKAPKLKIVSDWKPAIWDAVYRLEDYHDGALNRVRQGLRPDSQLQARHGGAIAGGICRSRLDAGRGDARHQSRVPPGRLQRSGGILQRIREGLSETASRGTGACSMTAGELIVQGNSEGADIVPPSLDQACEFARHSKAE